MADFWHFFPADGGGGKWGKYSPWCRHCKKQKQNKNKNKNKNKQTKNKKEKQTRKQK